MAEVRAEPHIVEETAHALGISGRTLRSYLQRGAPQGDDGALDADALRAWRAEHVRGITSKDIDASEEQKNLLQNRRLLALAEKTEIENAEQRGELVRREEIRPMLVARIFEVTQGLEGIEAEARRRFGPEFGGWLAAQHRGLRERYARATPYDPPEPLVVVVDELVGVSDADC